MSEISREEYDLEEYKVQLKNHDYWCNYSWQDDICKQALKDREKLEKIEKAIPDIEHLEELMIKMFEEWDCFKEHSYFEKLGIAIFSEGMQTVGYVLDCLRDSPSSSKMEQVKEYKNE